MRPRIASSLSVATLAVVALACDGRTTGILVTGPTSDVRVRMLNALTSSQAVDLIVDGQVASSGVPFGGASPYVALTAGSHRLQARSSTTGTILVDQTRDLNTNGSFKMESACNDVVVTLRLGVKMEELGQSRESINGSGTLRTTNR